MKMRLKDNGRPYGHDAWHGFQEIQAEYTYVEFMHLPQEVRDAAIDAAMGKRAPAAKPTPAVELSESTKALIAERLAALKKPLPAAAPAQPVVEPDRRTPLERAESVWRSSPAIREEFGDDLPRYKAYLQAEAKGLIGAGLRSAIEKEAGLESRIEL